MKYKPSILRIWDIIWVFLIETIVHGCELMENIDRKWKIYSYRRVFHKWRRPNSAGLGFCSLIINLNSGSFTDRFYESFTDRLYQKLLRK